MWEEIGKVSNDISTVKKLLVASKHIPEGTPKRWEIISKFISHGKQKHITGEECRILAQNIEFLDEQAFESDQNLLKDLIDFDEGLGLVLISDKCQCGLCPGNLLVRADRPSHVTLYSKTLGTVKATHYSKYCSNSRKGCHFVQYYGYHKNENDKVYDESWASLPYFMSSQETAFEMKFLREMEAEILIGQMTYNQICDIYNELFKQVADQTRISTVSRFTSF